MNNYQGINPFIIALVKKYARVLYVKFNQKIDQEDFQQDLIIAVIQALEKFNPRFGFIEDFVNKCLFTKAKEISRSLQRQKRKTFLNTYQLETVQLCGTQQNTYSTIELNNLMKFLPKGLRLKFDHLRYSSTRNILNNPVFKIVRKILSAVIHIEGVKKNEKYIVHRNTIDSRIIKIK